MSEYRNHVSRTVLLSPHYTKHVSAMTGEDLYSKGEIAEELAARDIEIERLREEVQRLSARLIEDRHAADIAHESATAPLEALHQAVRRYFRTEADRIEHEKARAAMREAMHAVNDAMENKE